MWTVRDTITSSNKLVPELQGEVEEISVEKCKLAVKEIEKVLNMNDYAGIVTEDTSLCYNALGGLPGPYM